MKKIFLKLFAVVLALSLLGLWPVVASAQEKVSKPGVYSGYSAVLYTQWVRNSQYVAMRDKTKLAVDIYRPAQSGTAVTTPYPVLYLYNWGSRALPDATGKMVRMGDTYAGLTNYGYVIAIVDARGTGVSYGKMVGSYRQIEAQDTYDLTEWFAKQPWCNGKVGMFGCSHMGQIEWLAAGMKPPHLKAIFPQCFSFDYYFGKVQGGIPGAFRPTNWYERDKTSATVDEDPTGSMRAEAVEQHKDNPTDSAVYSVLPFRDSFSTITSSPTWIESSPGTYLDDIKSFGVPTYQWGNWNDFMTKVMRDVFIFRANIDSVYKTSLGALGHCQFGTFNLQAELRRWFDYWMKGIDNGIMDEPNLYYITIGAESGKEWRFAWEWPLPNEKRTTYYLAPGPSGSLNAGVNDGILSLQPPSSNSAKDDYIADYTISSSTRDTKGLTYTTGVLTSNMEMTGYVQVGLSVSSTATDGDFFAFLEDVDKNGVATVVTQLQLRASHRTLNTPPFNNLGLPWLGNFERDMTLLNPGQVVELVFDPLPISYVFKAGNRVRLSLTCAYTGATFLKSTPAPTISVYRNATHASYISLPITTEPIAAEVQIIPGILNLRSQGKFTAFITLPENLLKGYQIEDIDISTLKCHGASAVSVRLIRDTLIAKFDVGDLADVSTGREVTFTVTGEFNYGIPFKGSDTILVIGK